ncbi:MAG: DUF3822 family protein [Cyclobacteriaceae bacterium]
MASASLSYKLIKKIKDEKFDVDRIQQYDLLLHLGVRDFQIGIVDTESDKLVFFEDYIFGNLSSTEDQKKLLQELFESHHLLGAGFWKKVKFSIKNSKFVQVPEALFVKEAAPDYLKFNAKVDEAEDKILWCASKNGAVTVFAIPSILHHWIVSHYKNTTVHFLHQSAGLIEGVLKAAKDHSEEPLYIYIDRFKLHIISVSKGKLKYYNQFSIKHFADYVKYIMLVLNAMGMNQQTSKILLWGYIGKNSPHSIEFSKYIKNVSFGSRPNYLKFGYLFDEIQDHHFLDLYSLHLLATA